MIHLNDKNRNFILPLLICLISGGLFLIIAQAIHTGAIVKFDLPIIKIVQGWEAGWLTVLFTSFTWIGSGYGVTPITFLICLLLFFKYNKRPEAILFAFSIVSTILLNEGLKRVFIRERPEIYRLLDAGGFSFPSGHTMMAVSLYAMIIYIVWPTVKSKSGKFLLVFACSLFAFLIAVSRIYVGVHYPSDIAGGFLMSTLWITLLLTGYRFFQQPSH